MKEVGEAIGALVAALQNLGEERPILYALRRLVGLCKDCKDSEILWKNLLRGFAEGHGDFKRIMWLTEKLRGMRLEPVPGLEMVPVSDKRSGFIFRDMGVKVIGSDQLGERVVQAMLEIVKERAARKKANQNSAPGS